MSIAEAIVLILLSLMFIGSITAIADAMGDKVEGRLEDSYCENSGVHKWAYNSEGVLKCTECKKSVTEVLE